MTSSSETLEKQLEKQLEEAGNALLHPSSSVDELLPLLDQVEGFLSKVEQSPSKSMLSALNPSIRALVADDLLKHSDIDVKVAVASCISEITRITAPDAPYDDDKMKDVFQLIVASFENLYDLSSRSYNKRVLILETVAKVRSCVVMLDLECDELIIDMFQHFLKAIRDTHPENVFGSMETIMTLVLEESEDISLELLKPILACLKVDEEIQPVSRKLGEKVFEKCAHKVKPYLCDAVKSLGIELDEYCKIVSSVCSGEGVTTVCNDPNVVKVGEGKLTDASSNKETLVDDGKLATASDEPLQVSKSMVGEEASDKEVDSLSDKSLKSQMSNGVAEVGNDAASVNSEPLKTSTSNDPSAVNQIKKDSVKAETGDLDSEKDEARGLDPEKAEAGDLDSEKAEAGDLDSEKAEARDSEKAKARDLNSEKAETGDLDSEKVVIAELKPMKSARRKGRKSTSAIVSKNLHDLSSVKVKIVAEEQGDNRKSDSKEVCAQSGEEPSIEASRLAENEKEINLPKSVESEVGDVASPSASGSLASEGLPKKIGRPKKKENKSNEDMPPVNISKKAPERTSDSEVKRTKRAPVEVVDTKLTTSGNSSKNDDETVENSEEKPVKQSGEKVDGSSSKKEDGKRRGRGSGKAAVEKDVTKPINDDAKESLSSPDPMTTSAKDDEHAAETPKFNSKRKYTPGRDKTPQSMEYGENLVGLKVKVWWPKDKMFYEGVVESFDHVKKKHKVVYTDGDQEILVLKKEKWMVIEEDASSDEQEVEHQSADASSDMPRKKKAKANSESLPKHGKAEISSKGEGSAPSSKSKASAQKSGNKLLRDDGNAEVKVREKINKSGGKSANDAVGKEQSHKSRNESVNDIPKKSAKSKDVDDGETPKTNAKSKQDTPPKIVTKVKQDTPKTTTLKSKQDTPKTASVSKGKTSQSGNKSSLNGTGKGKSISSKMKQADEVKERSPDSIRTPETSKSKQTSTSKTRDSESKSGKKRKRGGSKS